MGGGGGTQPCRKIRSCGTSELRQENNEKLQT